MNELRADLIALRRTGRSRHPDPQIRRTRETQRRQFSPETGPAAPITPQTQARALAELRRCVQP